jgi:hydrogenase-4 component H
MDRTMPNQIMIEVDGKFCVLCGACVGACRENAIYMGIISLSFDYESCTSCARCQEVCPMGALRIVRKTVSVNHEA